MFLFLYCTLKKDIKECEKMNSNNRRQHGKQQEMHKIVIRCKLLSRPVWEHEVCTKFEQKKGLENQHNCKNCEHAF